MQNAEGKEALGKSASCEYTGEDEMKIVVTVQIDRRLSAPEPLQMEKYMLDKDIREPLFDFLEEFYGKIRIFEEKVTGISRTDALGVIVYTAETSDSRLRSAVRCELSGGRKESPQAGRSAHPGALGDYLCL